MTRRPITLSLVALAVSGVISASDFGDLQFHGFASQGYLYTTENNYYGRTTGGGTFEFNEFGLNVVARPVERMRIGLQIFAADQGKFGNGELKLDWAYATYELVVPVKWADVSFTAGRFKTNHGFYNDYRDLDMTRSTVFLPMTVYPTTFRDLVIAANGFQLSGALRAGSIGSYDWSAFVGTQNVDNRTGTPIADQFGQGYFSMTGMNVKRMDGASLTWNTPLDGLRIKGSFMHATDLTVTGQVQSSAGAISFPATGVTYIVPTWSSVIFGSEFQRGNWVLAAEYLNEYYKVNYDYSADVDAVLPGPAHNEEYQRMQGAYGSVAYRFHPQWETTVGYQWMMTEDGLSRTAANDDLRRNEHRAVSIALRFDPVDHWLIKVEYQRIAGTMNIARADNPQGMSEYWNLFALKTTFDF